MEASAPVAVIHGSSIKFRTCCRFSVQGPEPPRSRTSVGATERRADLGDILARAPHRVELCLRSFGEVSAIAGPPSSCMSTSHALGVLITDALRSRHRPWHRHSTKGSWFSVQPLTARAFWSTSCQRSSTGTVAHTAVPKNIGPNSSRISETYPPPANLVDHNRHGEQNAGRKQCPAGRPGTCRAQQPWARKPCHPVHSQSRQLAGHNALCEVLDLEGVLEREHERQARMRGTRLVVQSLCGLGLVGRGPL
jgi:hypothetical protein